MSTAGTPRLVVIAGPIAAGKSALADEVARRLRERGRTVAVVAVDPVADMALRALDWAWAHEVHGQLVGAWLRTPVQTVVAEGLGTPAEIAQLARHVPDGTLTCTVLVTTSWETARHRAAQDPDRGLSADPGFLRQMHDHFRVGRPDITADLALDSTDDSPAVLAQRVLDALDATSLTRAPERLPHHPLPRGGPRPASERRVSYPGDILTATTQDEHTSRGGRHGGTRGNC